MADMSVLLPKDFPYADLSTIAERLESGGGLTLGYVPGSHPRLNVAAFIQMVHFEGLKVIILPDRNLISRMAAVARTGVLPKDDLPSEMAVDLMALSQGLDIQIEPSIAYHELAHKEGNDVAHEELTWFRAADQDNYKIWIDLALRRRNRVNLRPAAPPASQDLAFPLSRFLRNYIVALKIGALELEGTRPLDKALALLDWMIKDFFVAGPAALFGAFYFSPMHTRRLIKSLRSPDRTQAVIGIANAAWDMTHLSEFVRRSSTSESDKTRIIFATADRGLSLIAPALLAAVEPSETQVPLKEYLHDWWPSIEATTLATAFANAVECANSPDRRRPTGPRGFIADQIASGEKSIKAWKPAV